MNTIVALMGVDGAGKSTFARAFTDYLAERGVSAASVNAAEIFASSPKIQGSRILLGCLAGLSCLTYPLTELYFRLRGYEVLIVDHHPHADLPVFARTYSARLGWIGERAAKWYRPPDVTVHINVDIEQALRNISGRGKTRQWHETASKLAGISSLLREQARRLQALEAKFPAATKEVFGQLYRRFAS